MTFRRGQSGNPNGRPRIVGDLRDLCRRFGAEGVKLLAEIARSKDQPARARVEAIKELFARGYGRTVSASDAMFLAAASGRNPDCGDVRIVVAFGKDTPIPGIDEPEAPKLIENSNGRGNGKENGVR